MHRVKKILVSGMLVLATCNVQAASTEIPAKDFYLKSITGENLRLEEFKGQVVLLNFWASWCGPCRQEMPFLEKIHTKYKDLGFSVIGVNIDEKTEDASGFLKKQPVTFPILLDANKKVSEDYNIMAMPTTYIIDQDGVIRFVHHGYKPGWEVTYEEQIKELLQK